MLINVNTANIIKLLKDAGFLPGSPVVATPVYFFKGGTIVMASIVVKDNDAPLEASVSFLDARGNPASPEDTPRWSSSDESICSTQASDDGMNATVTINGPLGAAVIAVESTDADGTQIRAEGTITVQSSEAVTGEVVFNPAAVSTTP